MEVIGCHWNLKGEFGGFIARIGGDENDLKRPSLGRLARDLAFGAGEFEGKSWRQGVVGGRLQGVGRHAALNRKRMSECQPGCRLFGFGGFGEDLEGIGGDDECGIRRGGESVGVGYLDRDRKFPNDIGSSREPPRGA